ncbi:MAG: sigma-70 family RNA polymerase sigma factor [Bacteroidaceae bacterium]|nr:sigma-70 family RNA polymerase sigma factor [Bacteroidaceae bacterium]
MTNKETLERLFHGHYRQLFRLAMTLLHDEAESKDVVSEVFARMVESGREEGISYLLAAVRNRCLNVMRNRTIQQRIQRRYLLEQELEGKSAERLCEEARLLQRGIEGLEPPVCRKVIHLHFEEGRTFREIATELGTSETTVYKYLRRAMKQLRQHLNNEEL